MTNVTFLLLVVFALVSAFGFGAHFKSFDLGAGVFYLLMFSAKICEAFLEKKHD